MRPPSKAFFFRLMSITALTLAVLSPKTRWSHRVKDPKIAVVWDASASMAETDPSTGKTRWLEALSVWKMVQRDLPRNATVHHFLLGTGILPVSESDIAPHTPSDGACDFGSLAGIPRLAQSPHRQDSEQNFSAFGDDQVRSGVGQGLDSSSPQAILLFSDGRSSDGLRTAPAVPVFAIGVGGTGAAPDVAVESVEAPPLAFAGLPLEINARITASNLSPPPIPVTLFENGKRRAQSIVSVSSGSATVSFVFTPSKNGFSRCEVRIEPVPGETRTANNVRRFSMDVQRNRLRTIYIAGRPGPHYNFLRSQLKSDPAVELVSFVVLRDPEDMVPYEDVDLSLIPFPTSAALVDQLPTFDVVVLEDLSGVRIGLGEPFFTALEKWVQAGGGFLSIHEPADIRPVDIRPADMRPEDIRPGDFPAGFVPLNGDQNQDALSRLDPWATTPPVSGPERFRLKPVDPSHPVLSLAEGEANGDRWSNLGLLEGTGKFFSQVKRGAHILAVEPVNGAPVLAEWSIGKGHVLGMANMTSWRWALDGGRRGQGPADYQRFWENVVRWLASSPGAGSLRMVRPEGPLSANEPYQIQLKAPLERRQPPRLWVVSPEGKRQTLSLRPTEQKGEYRGDFIPSLSGSYEMFAEAGASNRDRMRIEVSSGWDESYDTRPDFARLADLARLSGGQFVEAKNVQKKRGASWFSSVFWESRPHPVGGEIVLGAFAMIMLALEWVFRRRRGLP